MPSFLFLKHSVFRKNIKHQKYKFFLTMVYLLFMRGSYKQKMPNIGIYLFKIVRFWKLVSDVFGVSFYINFIRLLRQKNLNCY